jgi:hypothetical protein
VTILNPELLYQLLPATYRRRDLEQGQPLQALLAIMTAELAELNAEIDKAYADCFIETCDTAIIPYIADLLGITGLRDVADTTFNQRTYVAKTLYYRRNKGKKRTLEQVISAATGWYSYMMEYNPQLAVTQYLNHPRPQQGRTAAIRDKGLVNLGTPFDQAAYTVDLRSTERYRVKYNLSHAGLFLWRLTNYPIKGGVASPVAEQPGCYTFHSLGIDMPLFNQPSAALADASLTETDLPIAIRPSVLQDDLTNANTYYGAERSLYMVKVTQQGVKIPITPQQLVVADLSIWDKAVANHKVAIDVERGRFKLSSTEMVELSHIEVNYYYGFSTAMGGGRYDRRADIAVTHANDAEVYVCSINKQGSLTLAQALQDCVAAGKARAIIELTDDSTYSLEETELAAGNSLKELIIQAANGCRPCLALNQSIMFNGEASGLQVTLNGLLMSGQIRITGNVQLNVKHCTLVPLAEQASLLGDLVSDLAQVTITDSLVGGIQLASNLLKLTVQDSLIDSDAERALAIAGSIQAYGPATEMQRVTVLGQVQVSSLSLASETIITGKIVVEQPQIGFIRYSSFPRDSVVPSHYRCQLTTEFDQPLFTSTQYGQPGYGQLSRQTSQAIRAGAEQGSEMGCFNRLRALERESRLQQALDEYLPSGLIMPVFYMN